MCDLFPIPIKSLNKACLASTDLLHTHPALAGTHYVLTLIVMSNMQASINGSLTSLPDMPATQICPLGWQL